VIKNKLKSPLREMDDTAIKTTGTDFSRLEDPAKHWIDLVIACHSGNPARVRKMLSVAKTSKWNYQKWDEMCKACESDDDFVENDEE